MSNETGGAGEKLPHESQATTTTTETSTTVSSDRAERYPASLGSRTMAVHGSAVPTSQFPRTSVPEVYADPNARQNIPSREYRTEAQTLPLSVAHASAGNHVSEARHHVQSTASFPPKAPPSPSLAAPHTSGDDPSALKVTSSAPVESRQVESSLKAQDTVSARKDTKLTMCSAESPPNGPKKKTDASGKSKKSEKKYEIPLTILPKAQGKPPSVLAPDTTARPARKRQTKPGQTAGRWTQEEHQAFLEGLKVFGREWKKVADRIPTRTSAQIRSHAQKYFAKLAREENLLLHEAPPAPPVAKPQGAPMSMSVQRNVERILADPTGAQREVEDTLRQLRERYRQLQIRLEESQRRQRRGGAPHMDRIVEDSENDSAAAVRRGSFPNVDRRKRTLEDSSIGTHDDLSSVSSDVSASLASLSSSRELGNEELIALHVLGGALPRSASGDDLQPMANLEEEGNEPARSNSLSDESETKRQRVADGDKDTKQDPDGDHTME